jgi:hypothetical protein
MKEHKGMKKEDELLIDITARRDDILNAVEDFCSRIKSTAEPINALCDAINDDVLAPLNAEDINNYDSAFVYSNKFIREKILTITAMIRLVTNIGNNWEAIQSEEAKLLKLVVKQCKK